MKVTDIHKIRNIIKDYLKYYDYYTPEVTSKVRITRSTAQTLTNADWTKIQYDTEVFDELSEYDNTTNYRFTAQKAGCYQIIASIISASVAWTTGEILQIGIYKNGELYSTFRHVFEGSFTNLVQVATDDIIQLNANDYIEIEVYHNQGGNINLHTDSNYNYFVVHRLS